MPFSNQSRSFNALANTSVPYNYAIQACIDYPNVSRSMRQRLNWWNCLFIQSDLSETWTKGKLVLHAEIARGACWVSISAVLQKFYFRVNPHLTLRLLMSYIYGAPSKARNANVVYIRTYVWQRWNSLFLFAAQCFNTESMQRGFLCHIWL